jgi:hypothetical protein
MKGPFYTLPEKVKILGSVPVSSFSLEQERNNAANTAQKNKLDFMVRAFMGFLKPIATTVCAKLVNYNTSCNLLRTHGLIVINQHVKHGLTGFSN